MNIGDLKDYLTRSELKQSDVIIFKGGGKIIERDFSKAQDGSGLKRVLSIPIELPNGKVKDMLPNKTSIGMLSVAFGDDTEDWVEKRAKVSYVDQMAFGKKMKVLLLEPITTESEF